MAEKPETIMITAMSEQDFARRLDAIIKESHFSSVHIIGLLRSVLLVCEHEFIASCQKADKEKKQSVELNKEKK